MPNITVYEHTFDNYADGYVLPNNYGAPVADGSTGAADTYVRGVFEEQAGHGRVLAGFSDFTAGQALYAPNPFVGQPSGLGSVYFKTTSVGPGSGTGVVGGPLIDIDVSASLPVDPTAVSYYGFSCNLQSDGMLQFTNSGYNDESLMSFADFYNVPVNPSLDTWYKVEIEWFVDRTVTFRLFTDAGALIEQWSSTYHATRLPINRMVSYAGYYSVAETRYIIDRPLLMLPSTDAAIGSWSVSGW